MSATILQSSSIDDRDGNVTYVPDRWTVHTNVQSIYHLYGNSDTFSDIQNSTATVKFYGNTIEYWGNTGPYHGPCTISVDGKEMTTVNSHADADGYPTLLYSKHDLALGDHELEVKVVDPSYPNVCEVDRFVANITSSTGSSSPGHGSGGGSKKSSPPVAVIAGAVGGATLCILLVGFWLYVRSKKKATRRTRIVDISKPLLVDDLPSSPPPQTSSFFSHNRKHPVSYASTSSPPDSSYNPPGSPPLGAAGTFDPYAAQAYDQGTHSSPVLSSVSSMPLLAGTHTSIGPTSIMSSTTGAPTMSYYSPGPEAASSADHVPNRQYYQQQPFPHVLVPEPSSSSAAQIQNQYSISTDPASTSPPHEDHDYTPRSEKAVYSGSSAAGSSSGSGAEAAGRARRDILSLDAPELPPPAYDA